MVLFPTEDLRGFKKQPSEEPDSVHNEKGYVPGPSGKHLHDGSGPENKSRMPGTFVSNLDMPLNPGNVPSKRYIAEKMQNNATQSVHHDILFSRYNPRGSVSVGAEGNRPREDDRRKSSRE